MTNIYTVFLYSSLVLIALGQQHQHPINTDNPRHAYNITLDFDDIPTSPSTGQGFHPISPHEKPYAYKSLYLQSFTLQNVSAPNSPVLSQDKKCSHSPPNSIFASRRLGYAWPRISLYDLTLPPDELLTPMKQEGNKSFGLISLYIKPLSGIPGALNATIGEISITLMRLRPDPRLEPLPSTAFPGLLRGEPGFLPWEVGHISEVMVFFPPDVTGGIMLDLRELFGRGWGTGADVLEITCRIWRKEDGEDGGLWREREDWEVCVDDVTFEIVEGEAEQVGVRGEAAKMALKANATFVGRGDLEWELLEQRGVPGYRQEL